jgi:hypothetical protein
MPIEKAFAINAPAHEIYSALEADLASAREHEGDVFDVIRRDPGRSLVLRVTISGFPCILTYTLLPRDAHTEVVAEVEPQGLRYLFFRIITLGLSNGGFDVVLFESLRNLKESVEAPDEDLEPIDEEHIIPD